MSNMPSNHPFIKSLSVSGLLSFGELSKIEFGSLNVLVGANGSGKSNLLDILRIFRNSQLDIQDTFKDSGFEDWIFRSTKESQQSEAMVELNIPGNEMPIAHHLILSKPGNGAVQVKEVIHSILLQSENVTTVVPFFFNAYINGGPPTVLDASGMILKVTGRDQSVIVDDNGTGRKLTESEYDSTQSILAQIRDATKFPIITRLASYYSDIRIYSDWSFGRKSILREASQTDSSGSQLSESMDNLALCLNSFRGNTTHVQIKEYMSELKSSYRDFFTPVAFGRVGLELQESSFDKNLPAKRLSDGTLRFLALLVILCNPKPPPVICLEEPELGMHPDMINLVAKVIIDTSKRTQIILTTHSERLLSCLQDDFDRLIAFDADENGTSVQSLTQEEYKEWRGDHDLGDLWTSGELGGVRY
ncbi:MAG: AAA family ATPase [Armatimonadota bacterium]